MAKKDKGFTLVELIVVIVILGILAAILVPSLLGYIDRSKDSQLIMHCRQAVMASETVMTGKYARQGLAYTLDEDDYSEIERIADLQDTAKLVDLQTTADRRAIGLVVIQEGGRYCVYENLDYKIVDEYEGGHQPLSENKQNVIKGELIKVKDYSNESHPLRGQFAGALFYENVDSFCSLMKDRGLDLDGKAVSIVNEAVFYGAPLDTALTGSRHGAGYSFVTVAVDGSKKFEPNSEYEVIQYMYGINGAQYIQSTVAYRKTTIKTDANGKIILRIEDPKTGDGWISLIEE